MNNEYDETKLGPWEIWAEPNQDGVTAILFAQRADLCGFRHRFFVDIKKALDLTENDLVTFISDRERCVEAMAIENFYAPYDLGEGHKSKAEAIFKKVVAQAKERLIDEFADYDARWLGWETIEDIYPSLCKRAAIRSCPMDFGEVRLLNNLLNKGNNTYISIQGEDANESKIKLFIAQQIYDEFVDWQDNKDVLYYVEIAELAMQSGGRAEEYQRIKKKYGRI